MVKEMNLAVRPFMKCRHAFSVGIKRDLRYSGKILFQFFFLKTLFLCHVIERNFRGVAYDRAISACLRVVAQGKGGKQQGVR